MDIQQSFAARLYDTSRKLGAKDAGPGLEADDAASRPSFAETVSRAAEEMVATVQRGEQVSAQAMTGGADMQAVVEALTATELALRSAVAVRDKVVEAYQDVLRMPV